MASENHAERSGQLLHMHLCGPMECVSIGEAIYFLMTTCQDLERFSF